MAKQYNDDLFEDTKMSFGQHLEELRVSLFKAIVGLTIGFLIGLFFAARVVGFIQTPLTKSLEDYFLKRAITEITEENKGILPPEIVATIKKDGVIPDEMKLDPFDFLEQLATAYPEDYGHLQPKRHQLRRNDVDATQVSGLCKRLMNEGAAEQSTSAKIVWNLLSDENRNVIKSIAGKQYVSATEKRKFVDVFDELLDNRLLQQQLSKDDSLVTHDEDIYTKPYVQRIRSELEENFDADQSRRLNRLLISAAFPQTIEPPRRSVVVLPTWKPIEVRVQSLKPQEAFVIWIKAALVTGVVLASPYVFWHVWAFVAAGLYPHERRYVYVFLPFSILLFLAGSATAFFFVFTPVLDFLFSFNDMMNIDPDPRISEWLSFVLFLPIGFGISFQLPLVMLFLERIGLFSVASYLEKWRVAILVIFVVSMLLTPADPISMLAMAIPLTVLYFGGIGLCRWMPSIRRPSEHSPDEI